jgi:DNA-binding CsgD family transcriptional regulator
LARKSTVRSDDLTWGLIASLYEANFEHGTIEEALEKVIAHLGAHTGLIIDQSLVLPSFGMLARAGLGLTKHAAHDLYVGKYRGPDTNPWIRTAIGYPPGTVILEEMMPSAASLAGTEFWEEIVVPTEAERVMGSVVLIDREMASHISVFRSRRQKPFSAASQRIFRALLPHVARNAAIRARLRVALAERNASLEALDHLPHGVVLFDHQGRPRFVNAAAERLFAARDGLRMWRGAISCSNDEEERALSGALAAAIATGTAKGDGAGDDVTVSRPSGKRPYRVTVAPLNGARLAAESKACFAAVFIADTEGETQCGVESLRAAFGFTTTEVLVASALCRGESLPEIADGLLISHNTVRTHLARMLGKTGARRQTDLVRMLLTQPAKVGRNQPV